MAVDDAIAFIEKQLGEAINVWVVEKSRHDEARSNELLTHQVERSAMTAASGMLRALNALQGKDEPYDYDAEAAVKKLARERKDAS